MTEVSEPQVLIETLPAANGYKVGVATLNAPKSLNALTLNMVELLIPQLLEWQADDSVACVVLRGSGDRALCAGGDVVQLRNSALANDGAASHFFELEYRLDYLIHTYAKPFIAWGNGVVMGGGKGLFSGASHRVVTAQTRMAMPEVTIGLYPDVGGSWFLNRMPGRTGLFLALTGAAMNAGDALFLGIADRFLKHEQWDQLIASLLSLQWKDQGKHGGQIGALLRELEGEAGDPPESLVRSHYDLVQSMTDADTVAEIVARITAYEGDDKWMSGAAKTLANGCPASVYIIYEQLKRTLHLSLKEVFQEELVLSTNCMRMGNFPEGVRALLVDKDRNPAFEPAELAGVTPEFVEQHFQSPWGKKPNPLADL